MSSKMRLEDYIDSLHNKMDEITKIEDAKEDKAKRHRLVNTVFMIAVLFVAVLAYIKVPDYIEQDNFQTEIAQIIVDEGYRAKPYIDTLGNATVGFGHMILKDEQITKLTPHQAIDLLVKDYMVAKNSVEVRYPWADGDVKLVLINMTYQMGPSRLSKFENAIGALKAGDYNLAAAELLDSVWASQTPMRASRLAARILKLNSSWW